MDRLSIRLPFFALFLDIQNITKHPLLDVNKNFLTYPGRFSVTTSARFLYTSCCQLLLRNLTNNRVESHRQGFQVISYCLASLNYRRFHKYILANQNGSFLPDFSPLPCIVDIMKTKQIVSNSNGWLDANFLVIHSGWSTNQYIWAFPWWLVCSGISILLYKVGRAVTAPPLQWRVVSSLDIFLNWKSAKFGP